MRTSSSAFEEASLVVEDGGAASPEMSAQRRLRRQPSSEGPVGSWQYGGDDDCIFLVFLFMLSPLLNLLALEQSALDHFLKTEKDLPHL